MILKQKANIGDLVEYYKIPWNIRISFKFWSEIHRESIIMFWKWIIKIISDFISNSIYICSLWFIFEIWSLIFQAKESKQFFWMGNICHILILMQESPKEVIFEHYFIFWSIWITLLMVLLKFKILIDYNTPLLFFTKKKKKEKAKHKKPFKQWLEWNW